ncbi:MAG: hypothetical protein ACWA41_05780 [Putridiphycobacter sp.]
MKKYLIFIFLFVSCKSGFLLQKSHLLNYEINDEADMFYYWPHYLEDYYKKSIVQDSVVIINIINERVILKTNKDVKIFYNKSNKRYVNWYVWKKELNPNILSFFDVISQLNGDEKLRDGIVSIVENEKMKMINYSSYLLIVEKELRISLKNKFKL